MSVDTLNAGNLRLLDLIAAGSPEAIAIRSSNGDSLDYTELVEQANYVGAAFNKIKVKKKDRVAVILPNGPLMASTFLSVASFATCAPLNPAFGRDDLEFYLDDLNAAAVIINVDSDSPVREVAAEKRIPLLEVEPQESSVGLFQFRGIHVEEIASPIPAGDGDIALILHTSGTTSRPKMVPLSHRNLRSTATAISETLRLSSEDVCLNVMPLFHIHGLVGVLLSSMNAGACVICTSGFDGERLAGWLSKLRPTWYSAVPTIHQSVLSVARSADKRLNHNLRLIRSSSSSLPPQVMADLEATFDVPVIESYGMTEAAHQMASNPLPPGERKPGSVGLPAGPEMGIMDDDGNLLPIGQTGEIVIRGPGVTAGYIENPDANAQAFTNDWFRTGDLGFIDADGYLTISGRRKEMINRGGENISPREIDEALLQHESVAQAVGFAVPHTTLGDDVAAAVVLKATAKITENELRRFAADQLATFKVPSRIVFVETIPKGPTGKLQRIGLYQQLKEKLQTQYLEPRTDLEHFIANVMADVLEVERVGANDNFFWLGGDSLKAARVLARLREDFQVELSAVAVFFNPTPIEMGLEITRLLVDETGELEELLNEVDGLGETADS